MEYQEQITEKLEIARETLFKHLQGVRTGRASISLFENILVDYYGNKTPLTQVASFNIPEARLVVIQPWDKTMLSQIEKAIRQSDLGLSPQSDGYVLRLNIPALTSQRRNDLVKQAKKIVEQAKVGARNIRRDFIDKIKKAEKTGLFGEDESKREQAAVDKILEDAVQTMGAMAQEKEKEILGD